MSFVWRIIFFPGTFQQAKKDVNVILEKHTLMQNAIIVRGLECILKIRNIGL